MSPAGNPFVPEILTITLDGKRFTFERMTSEEIRDQDRAIQEGPNMRVGTWSSAYLRTFGSNSNTDKLAMDCTFSFSSDGTFTAELDTVVEGFWSFRRYKPGSAYWYDFTFPGQRQYCEKTEYALTDEDLLTFRISTDSGEEFYQMHRSP